MVLTFVSRKNRPLRLHFKYFNIKQIMSKEKEGKPKSGKKEAVKSLKEKRADKAAKRAEKKRSDS